MTKKRYSKTRAGCRTCKVRKIRCDETFPTCLNCTKSNRRCTGVTSARASSELHFEAPLTLSRFPTTVGWLSPQETQYLDMFRRDLVNGLASGSWKRLILQVVADEPALYHAVVAFSAVSRGEPDSGQKHHDKALQEITKVFDRRQQSVNAALVYAVLSICYDLRRREPQLALVHLEYALEIVQDNLSKIVEDVVLAFMRLDLQAAVFLGWRAPAMDVNILQAKLFLFSTTFKTVEFNLLCLVNKVMRFIRQESDQFRYGEADVLPVGAVKKRHNLLVEMQQLQSSLDCDNFSEEQKALLKIQWASTFIMLTGSVMRDETLYDTCETHFESIFTAAETIMNTKKREFSLDMVLISPLYLVALKCRKTEIRSRALELLQATSLEGAWEGQVNYKIGEIVSDMEQNGALVQSVTIFLEPKGRKASLHIQTLDDTRLSRREISWA